MIHQKLKRFQAKQGKVQRLSLKNRIVFIISILLFSFGMVFSSYANENDDYAFTEIIANLDANKINNAKMDFNKSPIIVNDIILYKNPEEIQPKKIAVSINRKLKVLTIWAWNDHYNKYNIPYKSIYCSPNPKKTPTGIFHPQEFILDFHKMYGENNYCKYLTRFSGHFLIHSPIYSAKSDKSLRVSTYRGLGSAVSGGCVRVSTGDAFWLYNHLTEESPILIYDSDYKGPLDIEELPTLEKGYRIDPTNPKLETGELKWEK